MLISQLLLFPVAVLAVKNRYHEQSQSRPVFENWHQLFCLSNPEFYAPKFDTRHCSHVYSTFRSWLAQQGSILHFSEDAGPNEIPLPQIFEHETCTLAVSGVDRLWQEGIYFPNFAAISPATLLPGLRSSDGALIDTVEDILRRCLSQRRAGMQLLWNVRKGSRNIGLGLLFYVTGSSADVLVKKEAQQKAELARFLGDVFPFDPPRDRSKDLLPEFQDMLDQMGEPVAKKARHRK